VTVTVPPARTVFHRLLGWHARAMQRILVGFMAGVLVGVVVSRFAKWEAAVLAGWDAAELTFLLAVWTVILQSDASRTRQWATREDVTRDTARLLLLGASVASLVAVALVIGFGGVSRGVMVTVAVVTVVVSWTLVNTVFTLRYADLYYRAPPGSVLFGGVDPDPDYRDFAYLAFTIGMAYQVSDTDLRDRFVRRTVLGHAVLSYVFGVVIVGTAVNVIAGLAG
jgi:uncharacterized membrane protein